MPKKVYSLQSTVYRGSQKSEVGRHKKGFTLVELLIVISIIAVLSVVGLVSYTNFLKNSRDAKRQSDIKFIQSALEQYFADQKYYPLSNTTATCVNGTFKISCPLKSPGGTRVYLNNIPGDPINGTITQYVYTPLYVNTMVVPNFVSACNDPTVLCNNYCLFVRLEGTTLNSDLGCTPTGGYTYGVARP